MNERSFLAVVGLSLAVSLAAACSPSGGMPGADASGGDDAGDGMAAGGEAAGAEATIGPIDLAPGQEITLCMHVRLDLPRPIMVTRLTAELAPGSHHLIFYRSEHDRVDLAPSPCSPFAQTFTREERPLLIVEKAKDELVLPEGVGLRLEANQVVKFEAHYINATARPIQGLGRVRVEGLTVGKATEKMIAANLGFWGTTRIGIPPNSAADTGVRFQRGYTDTTVFALTTHQHRFGTRMRVWWSDKSGVTGLDPIADTTDWAEPPLYRVTPPRTFDGKSGLSFQCEWQNPTDKKIGYGESALEEMCFLWLYYYPSRGFDFCADGTCFTTP